MKNVTTLTPEQVLNLTKNAYGFVDRFCDLVTSFHPEEEDEESNDSYFTLVNNEGDSADNYLFTDASVEGCSVTFKSVHGDFETFTILVPAYDPSFLLK